MNHELYDDIELVRRVKIQRLRWVGYVIRMDDQVPAKKVFENAQMGRSPMPWGDQREDNF